MSSIDPLVVDMDVDGPSSAGPGILKRCSSAPMINEGNCNTIMTSAPAPTANTREQTLNIFGASQARPRRFSASFSPVPGSPISGAAGLRLTRIVQLRQEEHADISNSREMAHEREVQHTLQISQSWEDLSLMSDSQDDNKMKMLHINFPSSNFYCNSPSPTRLPSGFQSPTRSSRTIIRRSASPVLKPSPLLGVKRKLDDDKSDFYLSPKSKRFNSHSFSNDRGGGLLSTTTTSLQGSLSSVGTPESLSSADSPNFNYRNVDSPSPNHHLSVEPMLVSKNDHDMNESPS